jgi:hypothetical protein
MSDGRPARWMITFGSINFETEISTFGGVTNFTDERMQPAAFEERNWHADPKKWEKAYARMGGLAGHRMLGYMGHATRN